MVRLITRPAPCDALCSDSGSPLPRTTKPGDAIEPGMMPEHASARGRRALAMHDDFALFAVHDVAFFPREVVMVLDVEDHVRAELPRDVLVDERVVRRGVAAHQVHRGPVFLAVRVVEREPREVLQFLRQVRVAGHRVRL